MSQAEIENALRRGSNVEGSKLRIWKTYQLQPDRKLRAKALANEYAPYGPGGSSHTYLDGSSGWLDHDSKGLTFEHYPDHQKVLLRWDRVEKYIDLMIQSDRYLSDKERRAIDFPLELNAASAAEYTALKAQHPDTLVGFEAGGNFMFYGEDAAKVAKVLNSALFTRETALGEVQVTGFPPSLWARMVPLFKMMSRAGLLNSVWAFILPSISTPFLIMMFRQNSRNFPNDLMQAARIDGLSETGIFFRMYVPIMKSTYAAAAVITFMNAWNAYMWPKVVMTDNRAQTMPMLIANIASGYSIDYGMLMMGVLFCSIPTMIVFFVLQKQFAEGITGAVK